jgi:hypothetical protein
VGGGRCGHCTWARKSATWSARHGIHSHACVEASHGIDLLLLPDLESKGAGSAAEEVIGAVIEKVEGGRPRRHAGPRRGGGWGDQPGARSAAGDSNCAWSKKTQKHLKIFLKI